MRQYACVRMHTNVVFVTISVVFFSCSRINVILSVCAFVHIRLAQFFSILNQYCISGEWLHCYPSNIIALNCRISKLCMQSFQLFHSRIHRIVVRTHCMWDVDVVSSKWTNFITTTENSIVFQSQLNGISKITNSKTRAFELKQSITSD